MLRKETWMVALDGLWANKLRAFLTMLGVVIGSACIVLVVTVALTGRRYIISQIESVGSNLVHAEYLRSPGQAMPLSYEINLGDMEAVAAISQVVAVAGTRDMRQAVVVA